MLDIFLLAMRVYWDAGDIEKAAAVARVAALFAHPKAGRALRVRSQEQDVCYLSDENFVTGIAVAEAGNDASGNAPD